MVTRVLIEDTGQLAPGASNLLFTGSSTKRSLMTVRSNPHLARREVSYGSLSQPISELTPVASQSSCEGSRAVHYGSPLCPCLQLFCDTTVALDTQTRSIVGYARLWKPEQTWGPSRVRIFVVGGSVYPPSPLQIPTECFLRHIPVRSKTNTTYC